MKIVIDEELFSWCLNSILVVTTLTLDIYFIIAYLTTSIDVRRGDKEGLSLYLLSDKRFNVLSIVMNSAYTSKKEILKGIRNILIIQLGDIGDIVWAIPALRAVKKDCPEAHLSLLLREKYGDFLKEEPFIYRIFEVIHRRERFLYTVLEQVRLIRSLRKERFDLVIDLRSGDRGAVMAYLTGAPVRVSQFYLGVPFWRNWIFTHLLHPSIVKVRGAAEQSLRIVRELGIDTDETIPRLGVSEKRERDAREILLREGMSDDTGFVSLNPFSRWTYKEWDYDKWKEIIGWLWNSYRIQTVVLGAKEERTKAYELLGKTEVPVVNLVGKTTLEELAGVLRLSSLHIGVDSAAPHIAAAVGTPTITIYGPSDWYDWAPVGDSHKVVLPDLDCVPCHKKGCDDKGWSRCLDELTAFQVKKVIQETLDETHKSRIGSQ